MEGKLRGGNLDEPRELDICNTNNDHESVKRIET